MERSLKRAKELSQEQSLTQQRYDAWTGNAFEMLKAAFGENHSNVRNFFGQQRLVPTFGPVPEHEQEAGRRKRLRQKIDFLEAVIEELPTLAQTPNIGFDFFGDLDTDIRRVSEPLFKDGHCAESVSAAFKELNHQVKQGYFQRKRVELVHCFI